MIHSIVDYFRSSLEELRKVVWPSRKQVLNYTLIIFVAVVIATVIVAALDAGLSFLVQNYLI
jgi:preprotein translocase subunit SecE